MTIDLSDLYVFAPDSQTTRTSFSLVINPVHVCGTFRPSADAESAKRGTPYSLVANSFRRVSPFLNGRNLVYRRPSS
jgi:hypothetical protein